MSTPSGMTALLLQLEFPNWVTARPWTYSANFAVQEGLAAAGIDCLTVPVLADTPCSSSASWVHHAKQLLKGRHFDQVWVWLVHTPLDRETLEWIAGLAPVRVGLLMESLRYDEEDYRWAPQLKQRRSLVEQQIGSMTHVLAPDERDAEDLNVRLAAKALWWPPMVPERFITVPDIPPGDRRAVFHGTPYGARQSWVTHPVLHDRLVYQQAGPPTRYHQRFDDLQQQAALVLRQGPIDEAAMRQYVDRLRGIRLGEFQEWMAALPRWPAFVNLPSLAKFYGGRVFEGMAAGRPVISWSIQHHPKNSALFEENKDILLFSGDDPEALARHIDRLREDPSFAQSLAANAQRKVRTFHTAERRLRDTLHWIETGVEPTYGLTESPAHVSEGPGTSVNHHDKSADRVSPPPMTRQPHIHPLENGVSSMPPSDQPHHVTTPQDVQTDVFYTKLFVQSPYWSTPHPNPDEAARWTKIAAFLEYILREVRRTEPDRRLRMLDVGCGRGWLTNLATMYGSCEGIEPVAGVIDHARRLFPHLRFEAGTAESVLQRPDFMPYDVVLTSEVIEHVPHAEKDTFLAQLARLVKPAGYVILTTPRGEMWEQWKAIAPPNQPVEDWVTEAQLRSLFTAQGFAEMGLERVHVEVPNLRYIPAPTPADLRSMTLMPIYQVWVCQRAKDQAPVSSFTRPPMVSVIVPTFNRPERLREALESVLAQTYQDFEIIVVNDGISDIRPVLQALNAGGRITSITHDRNRGLAAARNSGLRAAKGQYIAYLDDDDRYLPEHLGTLVTLLEQNEYKAAYTDAWRVHETLQEGRYAEQARDLPYSHDFNPTNLLISNFFPVLCVMHARACLDDVGLFDESLFAHEDWDLWIRMATKYPFAHIRRTTAEFTWRTDGSSMTSGSRDTYWRTTDLIYKKYQPYAQLNPRILSAQRQRLEDLRPALETEPASQSYDCSIVIPVFNKMALTVQCLTALATVTDQVSYEVIVVDNGSSDGTGAFLGQLGGDVRVITNAENLGFAKACNQGARIARGKYVVFLNNDTIPLQGWLSALVAEAEAHPEVGIVGSKLLFADGTIQHAGVVFDRQHLLPYHIYRRLASDLPAVNQRREFQVVTGACMLIRHGLFQDLGGFDEEYRNGFEDVDLCLKAREKGHSVIYQPRSVLYHLESQTAGRKTHDQANASRLLRRWGDWWRADEDRHYHEDGYKVVRTNEPYDDVVQVLADARDQAMWAHVAATQSAALTPDWAGVRRELSASHDWPAEADVLSWAATLCERLHEPDLQRSFLLRYLELSDAPDIRLALARTLLEQGDLAASERHLDHLLAAHPAHGEGWLLRGILCMQREQYRDAGAAFASALSRGGARKQCLMGMGMASLGRAEAQGAWDRFFEVVTEEPDDADAIHWLLRAGTAQQRWGELCAPLRTYVQRNPGDLSARFALAGVLLRAEEVHEARREYGVLRTLAPDFDGLAELGQAIAAHEAGAAMETAHS